MPRLIRRFSLGDDTLVFAPPSHEGREGMESEELMRVDPVNEFALEVVSPDVLMMVRLLS